VLLLGKPFQPVIIFVIKARPNLSRIPGAKRVFVPGKENELTYFRTFIDEEKTLCNLITQAQCYNTFIGTIFQATSDDEI
jgi:hypothetical protein